MAHFARLGLDNIVEQVIVVDNINVMTAQGEEKEEIGVLYLKKIFGEGTIWVQTSYNGNFRKRYAGEGYTYNSTYDVFIPPKPFESWTLDLEEYDWIPPIPYPEDGKLYDWDETNQVWVKNSMHV